MILQRIMIIVGDAAFEPGTPAPEVWFATNERATTSPLIDVVKYINSVCGSKYIEFEFGSGS